MKTQHDIRLGTVFTGRVNGMRCKVVGIEVDRYFGRERHVAVCRDLATGGRHRINLDMLRRYEIDIEEEGNA